MINNVICYNEEFFMFIVYYVTNSIVWQSVGIKNFIYILFTYIVFILRSHIEQHNVLCLREEVSKGVVSINKSLIIKIILQPESYSKDIPGTLGWEKNSRGKLGPKFINLKNDLEPEK